MAKNNKVHVDTRNIFFVEELVSSFENDILLSNSLESSGFIPVHSFEWVSPYRAMLILHYTSDRNSQFSIYAIINAENDIEIALISCRQQLRCAKNCS